MEKVMAKFVFVQAPQTLDGQVEIADPSIACSDTADPSRPTPVSCELP